MAYPTRVSLVSPNRGDSVPPWRGTGLGWARSEAALPAPLLSATAPERCLSLPEHAQVLLCPHSLAIAPAGASRVSALHPNTRMHLRCRSSCSLARNCPPKAIGCGTITTYWVIEYSSDADSANCCSVEGASYTCHKSRGMLCHVDRQGIFQGHNQLQRLLQLLMLCFLA